MSNYGFILDTSNQRLTQWDHTTGAFVRDIGQYNSSFSPFFNTNFDSVTGLPLSFALGPTDFVLPCGLTSDAASVYALDVMTCRVLRFDAATGGVVQTFGGKRGIGAGRITPDSTKRSILAVANSTVWLTDNAGGFVSQFSPTGVFQNDYSIATWATAAGFGSVDQVTGIAWDLIRGHYWALGQDSANCYLIRVSSSGVAQSTGNFNLTTRLSIPGHSGTNAGRILTRGLKFFGGYLYFWSQSKVYRFDPLNPDGDLTLYTDANGAIAPGWIDATGSTLAVTSTAAANNANCLQVLTLPGGSISRSYAPASIPASGATDHVSLPWDNAIVPYAEDTNTRAATTISAKARVSGTTRQSIQAKANLSGKTTHTISAKARITLGTQQQLQALARVDLPAGDGDSSIYDWEIADSFGNFSRGFTINYRKSIPVQCGFQVDLWAGYDYNRLHLMTGEVDTVTRVKGPDTVNYQASGRDQGARGLESIRITRPWVSRPPNNLPLASQIIKDSAALIGLQVGALEFPDYPLWNTYTVYGKNILEICTELLQPWNLFARVEYVPVVRNKVLSILKVDWLNVPTGGYQIRQQHWNQISRHQELYLNAPRLNEVKNLIVRGAAYRAPATNLGIQTRVEYSRATAGQDVTTAFLGEIGKPGDAPTATKSGVEPPMVITETVVVETLFCDKLMTRDEKIYSNSHELVAGVTEESTSGLLLIARTQEQYYYIDPYVNQQGQIIAGNVNSIYQATVVGPGQNSLLWIIDSTHSGIVDVTTGGQTTHFFQEDARTKTEYFYDVNQQVQQETQTHHKFDTTTNQWVLDSLTSRTHSQVTGGAIRTNFSTFVFDNSIFKLSTRDFQVVGGARPDPNAPQPRGCLVSHQVQSPMGVIDSQGHVVDYGSAYYNWQTELPYIGQRESDAVLANALAEQAFQLQGYRWEEVSIVSVLNPNLRSHEPVSVEVEPGLFHDYWLSEVQHRFTVDRAETMIKAKRLTLEDVP